MTTSPLAQQTENRIRQLEERLAASADYQELMLCRNFLEQLLKLEGSVMPESKIIRRHEPHQRLTIVDAVKLALEEAGRPLATTDLVDEFLPKLGVKVGGAKPARNLTSMLSNRAEDIRNISWHGGRAWWFRNRDIPEALPFRDGAASEAETAGAVPAVQHGKS